MPVNVPPSRKLTRCNLPKTIFLWFLVKKKKYLRVLKNNNKSLLEIFLVLILGNRFWGKFSGCF